MRSAVLLSALAGLVVARPQAIDIDAVEALPDPTVLGPADILATADVAPTVAASSVVASMAAEITAANTPPPKLAVRDDNCAVQPAGSGPVPSPDTVDAFYNSQAIKDYGIKAPASVGAYNIVQGFRGLTGSSQQLGYSALITLTKYDTTFCAQQCDSDPTCQSFNIYVERDPSTDPGSKGGPCNPNPDSTINFKCTLYRLPIGPSAATNTGETRNQFQVVIASSNGYSKQDIAPVTVPGYSGPVYFNNAAINAPTADKSYITYKVDNQIGRYAPDVCADLCTKQTAYNKAHPKSDGSYNSCNFFNSYILLKNGVPQGNYCSFYTQAYGPKYATNFGQYRGTDQYTIADSNGYTINNYSGTTSN